jgi:serine/threonine protein kinase
MPDLPTTALGQRYHFLAFFQYRADTLRWLARDERTGETVVVALVDKVYATKLAASIGLAHPHVASVVDVVQQFDESSVPGGRLPFAGAFVVAEHIVGATLRAQLDTGPLNPARAVAWWLRLASAVAQVHARGGVVGGISPFSIVGQAEGRAIPPVLTLLIAPVVAATLSPERLRGCAAHAADDVWALYAALYWSLTGVAPFPGNSRDALLKDMALGSPTPLSAFGVREPELEEVIWRGLIGEVAQRAVSTEELTKSLEAWERGLGLPPRRASVAAPRSLSGIVKGGLAASAQVDKVVFDAAGLPTHFASERPLDSSPSTTLGETGQSLAREPQGSGSEQSRATEKHGSSAMELSSDRQTLAHVDKGSANYFARKQSPWRALLVFGILLGAALVFFSLNRSSSVSPSARTVLSVPVPAAASLPQAASLPASTLLTPAESLNACIESYFETDAFDPTTQLGFVCEAGDHRELASRLYELAEAKFNRELTLADTEAANASESPKAAGFQLDTLIVDNGLVRQRRPLGWYELLATAVIRRGCCPNATPVTLPETTGWCEQLTDVVRDLADDSAHAGDLAPRIKRFDKAVECLFANRVRRPYKEYKTAPLNADNKRAFQQFLAHAAVSDAKRRRLRR